MTSSPFSRPWLVGILRRDLLLPLGCFLRAVSGLGLPHLRLPSSDFQRERWLMNDEDATRALRGRDGLLTEGVSSAATEARGSGRAERNVSVEAGGSCRDVLLSQ
jgi:hypothetical protein